MVLKIISRVFDAYLSKNVENLKMVSFSFSSLVIIKFLTDTFDYASYDILKYCFIVTGSDQDVWRMG